MPPSVVPIRLRCDRWSLELSPCVVRLDPELDPEVQFACSDGDLEIEFVEGRTPFESASFRSERGAPALSGRLRGGVTAGQRYPFDLRVRSPLGFEARVRGLVFIAPGATSVAKHVRILRKGDGTLFAEPDEVTIFSKLDERVEWTCEFGSFTIAFDKTDGSPFEEDVYSGTKGGRSRSGRIKGGPHRSRYDYSVYVWVDGADAPTVLDPGVIVDDGGGDDGLSGGS